MSTIDRQAIIETLSRLVTPGIKLTALADELGARKHEYAALRELILDLVEDGTVHVLPGGAFALAPSGRPGDPAAKPVPAPRTPPARSQKSPTPKPALARHARTPWSAPERPAPGPHKPGRAHRGTEPAAGGRGAPAGEAAPAAARAVRPRDRRGPRGRRRHAARRRRPHHRPDHGAPGRLRLRRDRGRRDRVRARQVPRHVARRRSGRGRHLARGARHRGPGQRGPRARPRPADRHPAPGRPRRVPRARRSADRRRTTAGSRLDDAPLGKDGDAVVIEITRYPDAARRELAGKLLKVLGDPEDPRTEIEKILACAVIPIEFPDEAAAQARATAPGARPARPRRPDRPARSPVRDDRSRDRARLRRRAVHRGRPARRPARVGRGRRRLALRAVGRRARQGGRRSAACRSTCRIA